MRLERIADDIWGWGDEVRIPPGARMPARSVVVRLPDGGLVLHAPLAIDDALAEELAALGEVAHVVAPNAFHHLHVKAALARYPDAALSLVPALRAKRPDLPEGRLLGEGAPPAWDGALAAKVMPGAPKLDEAVFLHAPSKTLVVTDWVFNVQHPQGFATWMVLSMTGTWKRTVQSRLVRLLVEDRAAAARATREVLGWDFARVVPAHGEIIDGDGVRAQLERALAVMLSWDDGQ
jgi:hypothetical protein